MVKTGKLTGSQGRGREWGRSVVDWSHTVSTVGFLNTQTPDGERWVSTVSSWVEGRVTGSDGTSRSGSFGHSESEDNGPGSEVHPTRTPRSPSFGCLASSTSAPGRSAVVVSRRGTGDVNQTEGAGVTGLDILP